MVQPINYLGMMPQIDLGQSLAEGLAMRENIKAARADRELVRQKVEAARAAREQQEQWAQAAQEAMQTPTAEAFARLHLINPDASTAIKSAWDGLDKERQTTELQEMAALGGLLRAGRPEMARERLQARIEADKAAGQNTAQDEQILALIDQDPAAARFMVDYALSSIAGPEKFGQLLGELGEEARAQELQPSAVRKAEADATKAAVDAEYADEKVLADLANIDSQIERRRHETAIGYGNLGVAQNRLELDRAKAAQAGTGKEPSESERTAGFLASRLAGALQDITKVTGTNPKAATPGHIETVLNATGAPEAVRNTAMGGDRQRVVSAQLDALDAALTLGTGAAYNREQLEGYRTAYFPVAGDNPQTVRDKTQRFIRLLEAAKVKAGRAAPPQIDEAIKAARGGLRADREGAKDLPKGAVMVGTSGGQPVYQLPDGRKVKWSD